MERRHLFSVIIFTSIASLLPDVLVRELFGIQSIWLRVVKLGILAIAVAYCMKSYKTRALAKYLVILTTIIAIDNAIFLIQATAWWTSLFDTRKFVAFFGSSILLKFISIIPVAVVLLLLYKQPQTVYLTPGQWSAKASRISWLGIDDEKLGWGKLSIISAIFISIGTILLTIITTTGFSTSFRLTNFLQYLPVIIVFAVVNSYCEGLIYRNSILGSLKEFLPKRESILIAAVYFGMAHYDGVPHGAIGVVMSSLLGWYMCRSMYESKGFFTSWIIHFMQDTVIFSTMFVLGDFLS